MGVELSEGLLFTVNSPFFEHVTDTTGNCETVNKCKKIVDTPRCHTKATTAFLPFTKSKTVYFSHVMVKHETMSCLQCT